MADRHEVTWVSTRPWIRYYLLHARNNVEKWCWQCDTYAAICGLRTRNLSLIHQYIIGTPFEKKAIDVAGHFPWSDQGNRYLLLGMDYFMKWLEAYAIPNQEALTVSESFCFILLEPMLSEYFFLHKSCVI
jgi:hypothetical protein